MAMIFWQTTTQATTIITKTICLVKQVFLWYITSLKSTARDQSFWLSTGVCSILVCLATLQHICQLLGVAKLGNIPAPDNNAGNSPGKTPDNCPENTPGNSPENTPGNINRFFLNYFLLLVVSKTIFIIYKILLSKYINKQIKFTRMLKRVNIIIIH